MKPLRTMSDLDGGGRTFIYGAGPAAGACRVCLRHWGVETLAFLDSFSVGEKDGLPVWRFDDYVENRREDGDRIVVASAYRRDIERTLRQAGINDAWDAYALSAGIGDYESRLSGLLKNGRLILSPG